MNKTAIEDALYPVLTGILTGSLVWSFQNAPVPDGLFTRGSIESVVPVGHKQVTAPDSTGDAEFVQTENIMLYLQSYGSGAYDELLSVERRIELPSKLTALAESGLVYVRNTGVTNVTDIIKERYEEQAALDIELRIADVQTDEVGYIDTVSGEGKYKTGSTEITSEFTYGG